MLLQLGDNCDCVAQSTRMVFLTTQGEHVRDQMEKGAVEVPVLCLRRAGCGYAHQAVVQDAVGVLHRQARSGSSQEGVIWSDHREIRFGDREQ